MANILSGKVKKIPPSQVSADRYNFLKLSEAEPDLGVPSIAGYVLSSDAAGNRTWINPTASSATQQTLLDDVSGLTDSSNAVFTLKINGVAVLNTFIVDSKDLQVTVDGKRLQPYTNAADFVFMPSYDACKGFRVRENRLIIYNAPEVGSQISLVAQPISTTKQIRRYPFSATNIGLGV